MHRKSQSHDVRFLKYRVRQTKFLVILGHFLPFYHPQLMILNIKIKKKNKNAWRCYPFIYMCTINKDHMMYVSWNIRCDSQKSSKFCAIFCPFGSLTNWKFKILKLKKVSGHIILQICTINDNHDICLLRYGAWSTQFFVILDHCLHFYPPNNSKNQKLEKWEIQVEILSFWTCVPLTTIILCMVPEIWTLSRADFLVILDCFLHFYPLPTHTTQKSKTLKKWKNWLEILSFYTCVP